jgi:hypothetical protein
VIDCGDGSCAGANPNVSAEHLSFVRMALANQTVHVEFTLSSISRKLRELAREFRFPGARRELLDLASRYERRADNLDSRNVAGFEQDRG